MPLLTPIVLENLANIADQWSNRLVPLTNTLPNGVTDPTVDAFANGLDGQTMYVKYDATAALQATYYNTAQTRPRTVYEQFGNVYQNISFIIK